MCKFLRAAWLVTYELGKTPGDRGSHGTAAGLVARRMGTGAAGRPEYLAHRLK